MTDSISLAAQFEGHRDRLRAVAYRMLGSLSEADDAVQEAWLHLDRSGATGVENLGAWLTTVVARVCLDMLRQRKSRREDPLDGPSAGAAGREPLAPDPEQEALMADAVGLALLVVLEALAPAERVAFVLHDLFALPFDEIAEIVGRSPEAARQLASRARRRVQGVKAAPEADVAVQRAVVGSFLTALRGGDVEGLLAVLDPDVVVRSDRGQGGGPSEVRGATTWVKQALGFAKGAHALRPALVDGAVGMVLAPRGKLTRVFTFTFAGDKITGIDAVADPATIARIALAVMDPVGVA